MSSELMFTPRCSMPWAQLRLGARVRARGGASVRRGLGLGPGLGPGRGSGLGRVIARGRARVRATVTATASQGWVGLTLKEGVSGKGIFPMT